MTIDRAIMRFSSSMILLGLTLSYIFSPYWLLLVAFVGLNMLQASFTGFCPLVTLFKKMGMKSGAAFD